MKYPNENEYLLQDNSSNNNHKKKPSSGWTNYQSYELNQFKSRTQPKSESVAPESTDYLNRDQTFVNYEFGDQKYSPQSHMDREYPDPETELMGNRFNKLCVELYNSKATSQLYLYLFLSNIVILIDTLFFDKSICLLLEAVVALLFSMEVYSNYILHGSKYYKSFEGILDITMVSCCLLYITSGGYLRFVASEYTISKTAEHFEILLVIVRLIVQSYRLVRYFLRHRKSKKLFGEYIALPVVNTV